MNYFNRNCLIQFFENLSYGFTLICNAFHFEWQVLTKHKSPGKDFRGFCVLKFTNVLSPLLMILFTGSKDVAFFKTVAFRAAQPCHGTTETNRAAGLILFHESACARR